MNTTQPASAGVVVSGEINVVSKPPRANFRPIRRGGAFVVWLITGFGLIPLLLGSRGRKSETIVIYTVHPAFYLWPLIALGFVAAGCLHRGIGAPEVWGWVYMWAVVFTFVTLLFDLNSGRLLFWAGLFCFLWLGSRYLEDLKNIPVVTDVVRYFHGLHPQFDAGFALALSTLLTPAWLGALAHSFFEGKKTFTPNSIEERYVGHGCEIVDRSGLKFRVRYRDLLETLLGFGAADLEAINGQGETVKRWNNILFLAFGWRKLDEILHQRAAVVDNVPADPVEVEDANK